MQNFAGYTSKRTSILNKDDRIFVAQCNNKENVSERGD